MRIGFFTDTYRPSINGITFVVETLKHRLEEQGHEVFVFCPARSIRPSKNAKLTKEDDRIVRFPSVRSGFFDDFDISLFFPPHIVKQIAEMDLDVVHVFTPSQIGLLGVNTALRSDIPLIYQHCTDLYEFAENYPNVLPGILALLGVIFPTNVKLNSKDISEIIKMYRPKRGRARWSQAIIAKAITLLYSKADAVIALSPKSFKQLAGWQDDDYVYPLTLMPNGVNAIPKATIAELIDFKKRWNIDEKDEVYGFVGRLAEEKNLPILIKALPHILKKRPRAKLLFVGDFEYRATLEELAKASGHGDRIVFTGAMPREQLGVAYAAMDVFTFPSLKDTQGWVLHEAAHAKKPIVLIDREVSEVVLDGVNGFFARNNATDFARKVSTLLGSPTKRRVFGEASKQLAGRYTEQRQAKKLVSLYNSIIKSHSKKTQPSDQTSFSVRSILRAARSYASRRGRISLRKK